MLTRRLTENAPNGPVFDVSTSSQRRDEGVGWLHPTVVASGGDNQRRVDGVRVHARLVIVVHRDQGPVGDHTGDADPAVALGRLAGDQVLNGSGVEQLDVGHLQHLGQHSRREQRSVFNNNKVALVVERHAQLAQEDISRLAHHHGGEELASQPGSAAGGDSRLDDGDLQVRAQLAERVGGAEAARAGADDDDVRLGVRVEIGKVTAGHGTRDLALADGREGEGVPVAHHVGEGLGESVGVVDRGVLHGIEILGHEGGLGASRLSDSGRCHF